MGKVGAIIATVASIAVAFIPVVGIPLSVGLRVALTAGIAALGAISSATMKKPSSKASFQGSVSQIVIGANMPLPYTMGRTFLGGHLVYDVGYGGSKNSDRSQVLVYSAAGPIDSFESFQGDFSTVGVSPSSGTFNRAAATGTYGGFLWVDGRKGTRPDTALQSPSGRPTISGWGSTYKLSGLAALMVTMKFDEDGKVWGSGLPQWGAVLKGVLVYDPRLDSTYPGGSGSQRWSDESTWAWSENPALHALTYARGRFYNGIKMVGAGIPQASIDIPSFVALANVCDTNGWKIGGAIYEGPNLSKWDNLNKLLEPAASQPAWVGGVLTCVVSAPKTSLDTITGDDMADGAQSYRTSNEWRSRVNTVVPRYRSEAHKWDYVQANAVSGSTYITEDGETKTQEVQFDLVQSATHAAQMAGYQIVNSREFGPITLTLKPRLMAYYPGEALTINLPDLGLTSQLAMITDRKVDPSAGTVQLTFVSETTAKHSFALGLTGVAPPTPTIIDPATRDAVSIANALWLNGDYDNMIPAPVTLNRAQFYNSAVLSTNLSGTGRPANRYRIALVGAVNSTAAWCGTTAIPCSPNEKLYYQHAVQSDISTPDNCDAGYEIYDAAGSLLGAFDLPQTTCGGSEAIGTWVIKKAELVTPLNAAFIRPYVIRPAFTTGTFYIGEPLLSRGQPGSTRNDDGGNMIPSPGKLDQASFVNGSYFATPASTASRLADRYRLAIIGTNLGGGSFAANAGAWWCSTMGIMCSAGEALYYQVAVQSDLASGSDTLTFGFDTYDASGTIVSGGSATLSAMTVTTATAPAGTWKIVQSRLIVPAGAAFIRPWVSRPATNAGTFYVAEPLMSRAQPGSDITATAVPDITGSFDWQIAADYTGAITTTLPADRRFVAMQGTTDVSTTSSFVLSSVSPSLSLTVNNTSGDANRGVVTMGTSTTGSGTAVLTTITPNGGVKARTITVTKTNAGAPSGGGSGSGSATITSLTNPTSSIYAVASSEVVVRSDSAGKLRFAIDAYYGSPSSGGLSCVVAMKISYATSAGGSLTDIVSEKVGSLANAANGDGEVYSASTQLSMPAANTDYYFKVQARRSAGTYAVSLYGVNIVIAQ